MIAPVLGILAVCAMLAGLLAGLKLMERWLHPHPELLRKLMHVGMGLVVISFPWVFHQPWPVLVLAAISTIALAAVKLVPRLHDGIGSVLTAVRRPSLGEVSFPIAVAALMLLSHGNKLLFVVPMLIMTLADTVAALVGIAYGKVRYVTSEGFKSVEGSIAFFTIAFFSVHVPLLLYTSVGRTETLLIALIIGLLSMVLEAIAARGLDNLLIPLGAFAFLKLYLHASIPQLELRLTATLLLGIFSLLWRNRTSLDDSALLASALFGYGALMLGGWLWLIGPTLLFLVHVYLWPRFGERRVHSIYAVASVTGVGLVWLALRAASGGSEVFLFPYAVGFGAHLAIIGVSRIGIASSPQPKIVRLLLAILAGWALALCQLLPLWVTHRSSVSRAGFGLLVAAACIAVGALVFYFLLPVLYGTKRSDAAIHSSGFASALLASTLATL